MHPARPLAYFRRHVQILAMFVPPTKLPKLIVLSVPDTTKLELSITERESLSQTDVATCCKQTIIRHAHDTRNSGLKAMRVSYHPHLAPRRFKVEEKTLRGCGGFGEDAWRLRCCLLQVPTRPNICACPSFLFYTFCIDLLLRSWNR
jgi:hypothetical protein